VLNASLLIPSFDLHALNMTASFVNKTNVTGLGCQASLHINFLIIL
jgi:hypothetical protein